MKTLPDGMQAHLAGGATTLCWCWRLSRSDGIVLGFTDHDRALTFDGTTFEASDGFQASELGHSVGLNVDDLDVSGAITSDRLEEGDLLAGVYDDAAIEIFRVNWQDVSQRVLMRKGSLGEVRRADGAFTAEIRGLAHYLQQPRGRLFQYACDAVLGDARCGVDLTHAQYRGVGTIATVTNSRTFVIAGLPVYASGWFSRGLMVFGSGGNAGHSYEIRRHATSGAGPVVELWRVPAREVVGGESVTLTAGCDKVLASCRDKFANVVNFRGFPHMPGMDLVSSYVRGRRG